MLTEVTPTLLASIAQRTASSALITDRQGRLLWVNEAFERLTGYQKADVLGLKPGDFLQGRGTRPETVSEMSAGVASGKGFKVEVLNYSKTGTPYWLAIDCQPLVDAAGEVEGFLAVQTVITALREAEERWKFALNSADAGVWDWDLATGRVFYSSGWKSILGLGDDEVGDRIEEFTERVHPDDAHREQPRLEDHLAARTDAHVAELRMKCKDGSWKWILSRGRVVMRDADGKPARMIGVHYDISTRKRAEAAVERERERTQLALQAVGMGTFRRNLRTGEGEWDATMRGFFGYPLTGPAPSVDEIEECLHPDDRGVFRKLRSAAEGPEVTFRETLRVLTGPGGLRYLEMEALLQLDEEGRRVLFVGVARDVTERTRQELKLRTENGRLMLALHGNKYGVWEFDFATGRLLWDEQMHHIFQVPLGQFKETVPDWQRHIHPADLTAVNEKFQSVLSSTEPIFGVKFRIVRADGEIRYIEGNGVLERGSDGRAIRAVGLNRDVTASHLAEVERRHVDDRLRLALASSRMVWWEWNIATGSCPVMGEGNECMLGYKPGAHGEQTFASWLGLTHPDDREQVQTTLNSSLVASAPLWICEHRLRTAAGGYRWVRQFGRVTDWSPEGKPSLMTGTTQDIEDQRRLADEQRAVARRQLQLERQMAQDEKMKTLGTLAGGIAHDFNNLLASISGYLELAQRTPGLIPEVQKFLQGAQEGTGTARDLVRQILLFAREVPGQPHVAVSLAALVRRTVVLLATSIPSAVRVEVKLADDPAPVLGDPGQLQQVLMNLCINAAHAIGGDTGLIQITTRRQGASYLLAVKDSGRGMDPEIARHIFDPFFTTKEAGQGSGLGLAIVHGIVHRHGGTIRVESAPGLGSVFTVELPSRDDLALPAAHQPAPAVQPMPEVPPAPPATGVTILMVDDDANVSRMTVLVLQRSGFAVEVFTSSPAALSAFEAAPDRYNLILADMSMPELSGVELARTVLSRRPNKPVLLISGDPGRFDTNDLRQRSNVRLLEKPFSMDNLAQELDALLARSS